MKIKFKSDDDLPLGKILNIPVCIIAVGSAFQKGNNYYPQVYLYECLYEYEDDSYSIVYMITFVQYIALIILFVFLFPRQNLRIHQLHKAFYETKSQ